MQEGSSTEAHYQISFFSSDRRFPEIGDNAINVPATAGVEELNLLVNTLAKNENEEWIPINFDFLIGEALLRSQLEEFVASNRISTEKVIKIECILKEPPPIPQKVLHDDSWVSDIKSIPGLLFSTNYAGQLCVWSAKGERLLVREVDNAMAKCLDVFEIGGETHAVVGVEHQFLTLYKLQGTREEDNLQLTPCSVLRGHQRSVECVAAKLDDNCLKVWNTEDAGENSYERNRTKTSKKSKRSIATKVPMVTLESHREVVTGVKWDPRDERRVVTVSWDCSAICWDLETAENAFVLTSNKAFTCLSLHPCNGTMLSGSTDPVIRLWDSRSREGSLVKQSFLGHRSWVSSVCWAPDEEYLFASGSFDRVVKLWDVRSPKTPLYDITGHEDKVLRVDWSVKEVLSSASADATIRTFSV